MWTIRTARLDQAGLTEPAGLVLPGCEPLACGSGLLSQSWSWNSTCESARPPIRAGAPYLPLSICRLVGPDPHCWCPSGRLHCHSAPASAEFDRERLPQLLHPSTRIEGGHSPTRTHVLLLFGSAKGGWQALQIDIDVPCRTCKRTCPRAGDTVCDAYRPLPFWGATWPCPSISCPVIDADSA